MRNKEEIKPQRLFEISKDFAIWRVPIELLREQDKNARVMDIGKFERLVENIKQDGRMESMPLCQLKKNKAGNDEFYIISGHHRTRAAIKAGLTELLCLVIEREMSRDEIISKQLSHNSLVGYDDPQVLKELYSEIDAVNSKIYSGLIDLDIELPSQNIQVDDIKIDLNYELINILFLPTEVKMLDKIIKMLDTDASVMIADKKDFDKFAAQARKIAHRDNIRNVSAIFARMLEIIDEYLKLQKNKSTNKTDEK